MNRSFASIRSFVVFVCWVMSLLAGIFGAAARVEANDGSIVFSTSTRGHGICVMNGDGSAQMVVPNVPFSNYYIGSYYPCLSPDGNKIVFMFYHEGGADLWLMNRDGSQQTLLVSGWNFAPAFSPDGTKIAFWRRTGEVVNSNFPVLTDLFIIGVDGGAMTRLTYGASTDFNIDRPAFSPDGKTIAFAGTFEGEDIYKIDIDGTHLSHITDTPYSEKSPTWSPDGKTIAFARMINAQSQIFSMNPDGSEERNLTNNLNVQEFSPCFSPDGTRITFSSLIDSRYQIYSRRFDGGERLRLTEDLTNDYMNPHWSIGQSTPQALQLEDITIRENAPSPQELPNFDLMTEMLHVKLSYPSPSPISVNYTTTPATATAPSDFVAKTGTLVFEPGQVDQYITLMVRSDWIAEPEETFYVDFSNPQGALLPVSRCRINIVDDDEAGLYFWPYSGAITEERGQNPGSDPRIQIRLTSQPASDVTVDLVSSNSHEGIASPSSLTFTPQNWQTERIVEIHGVDDMEVDGNQNYTITALTHSSDPIYDALKSEPVRLTNYDNDRAILTMKLSANSIVEGNDVTATISRNTVTSPIKVEFWSAEDWGTIQIPESLTLAAGQATATVDLNIPDDAVATGNRSIVMYAVSRDYDAGRADLTIVDNEGPKVDLQLSASTVTEDNSASGWTPGAALTIRRNTALWQDTPALDVALKASLAGQIVLPAKVTIPRGQPSLEIYVPIIQNTRQDGSRTVVITGKAAGHLAGTASLTILDDDTPNDLAGINGQVDLQAGTISGQSAQSLSGVTVTLMKGTAAVSSAHTDQKGNYQFRGLRAGSYTVVANKTNTVFYPPRINANLRAKSNVTLSKFNAIPQGRVEGVVLRSPRYATPVPANVSTVALYTPTATYTARVNSDGHFVFSNLQLGPYTIVPLAKGQCFAPRLRSGVLTMNNLSVVGCDFHLEGTDNLAPAVTVIEPRASLYHMSALAGLRPSGSASDSGRAGVVRVSIALARFVAGQTAPQGFLDWRSTGTPVFIATDRANVVEIAATGAKAWQLTNPQALALLKSLSPGFYGIRATVMDAANNQTASAWKRFKVTAVALRAAVSDVESPVQLSTLAAGDNVIRLVFNAPLNEESAVDAASYRITIDGQVVSVESVTVKGSSVILGFNGSDLRGSELTVEWDGLLDMAGRRVYGEQSTFIRQ